MGVRFFCNEQSGKEYEAKDVVLILNSSGGAHKVCYFYLWVMISDKWHPTIACVPGAEANTSSEYSV